MASISPTPANVLNAGTGNVTSGTAGESLVAGEPVYLKAADSQYYKAITTDAATAAAVGSTLHAATAGQPIDVQTRGDLTIDAVAVAGETYYVSSVAGDWAPAGDVANPQFVTKLGIATSTTNINMRIHQSGVARTA